MKWSYGVTTVPKRLGDLLPRTLASLSEAGFPKPRLFVDGGKREENYRTLGLEVTTRRPELKTFANWTLALWELYAREPTAERYAVFQDDFVTYRNLRSYLESCKYPDKGYWNLYTFPVNQKLAPKDGRVGWYLSNQLGKGAVALVFSRKAVTTLLGHPHMVERPQGARGTRAVDGGIVSAFKKAGWKEYVHNPSLVQHTGIASSMRNRQQELANSFRGEQYDAKEMMTSDKPIIPDGVDNAGKAVVVIAKPNVERIGLVGFNCASGLGEKNRQLSTWLDVEHWLIRPHRSYKMLSPPAHLHTTICDNGRRVEQFVKSVDVILFDETPFYNNLTTICKRHGKRIVCILAMEWLPTGGWIRDVDLFICPTYQGFELYRKELPCHHFPWPVDTDRFKFKLRLACEQFLFLNGRGGWQGRKGADVICRAKQLWPEMPLLVRSQRLKDWPNGTKLLPKVQNNADLYSEGDVLVAPHTIDGTGLEPMEAMACGMPVVTTDGQPWNELPAIGRIAACKERKKIRRMVDWYKPDPKSVVAICKKLVGNGIATASKQAREWAEGRSFAERRMALMELICHGKPSKA